MTRVYRKLSHIAEGMQHAHAGGGGKQKSEHITQTQVVIDIAQQHQQQNKGKGHPLARGQNVNAPLVEHHRAGFHRAAESPVAEFLLQKAAHF
jgi:hypothetical protein